jgi:hypothetical protein
MSTKSTIFLTSDNEHCYSECASPHFDENKNFIGDSIILEMSKTHTDLITNDNEDIIVEIKPGNELYQIFSDLKRKPFYEVAKLMEDLIKWEETNFIEEDLLIRIKSALKRCQPYF